MSEFCQVVKKIVDFLNRSKGSIALPASGNENNNWLILTS